MVIPWQSLGLQARFMLVVSAGLMAIGICVVVLVAQMETGRVEATLRAVSESELLSLNALVSSAMEQRGKDKDDVAVKVSTAGSSAATSTIPAKCGAFGAPTSPP